MRDKIYVALVHYPVYNKHDEVVATSVTNFDIHDISRTSKTYGVEGYYIVTPVDAQKELTGRIIGYWQDGFGGNYNKDREQAFSSTYIVDSIEKAMEDIENKTGKKPLIITTSARTFDNSISYKNLSSSRVRSILSFTFLSIKVSNFISFSFFRYLSLSGNSFSFSSRIDIISGSIF